MKNSPFECIPRRRWLAAGAGAVSTLAWSAAAAQPNKAPETRLRLAAAWPDKMPGLSDAVRRWAQRVNTLSGGQLQIDVRFSGESGIQCTLGAFVTILIWMWVIARYPATQVTSFSFLSPMFTLVIAILWLGEPWTWSLAIAMAGVAAGIVMVNRPAVPAKAEAAQSQ